ncbi:hypothetical protein O6H91_09G020000 [Diphasiastrum complanatum]|uniref:Uncharacterized protein n=2 Tax=Diphasiastrum complanatum TaxID=34168 RepID=A0ACC2CLW5_DIPCM|nr:hypothetical protein O6H91_09G020000 [Diphasiastrum complanatum]KAJ7542963.1 hypothetical protein O6H91_09G020000 [Diphasiastrum complanatum]
MALVWSHSCIANCQRAERLTALASTYTHPVRIALIGCLHSNYKAAFLHPRLDCRASADSASATAPAIKAEESEYDVPKPIVLIDQDSDPNATVVKLSFGDRLGALLDTMKALKDLGLNVVKGTVTPSASSEPHEFVITRADTGRKVEDPELLEAIRLTIINNLLQYHPESSEQLALGEAFGTKPPANKPDINFSTRVTVQKDGPKRSLLTIETADRPGLLLEIIKVLTDISVAVESGEIDTEGLIAKDKFHVSYRGAALSKSLEEVLTNALRYFLRRPQTDEDSY